MNRIKVEILGTGCKKCHQLEANAKEAIAALNLEAEVFHITDTMEIVKRGIMKTPALAVNDKIVSQGKLIEPEQIQSLLSVQ
ncbi:thioredoxin family protein [Coleofasciculus sp.]|uniref:thioredoxin family protein n=1 Tax=Coleofasciculus sp. TaxID=3100458 RepID=UPI003A22E2AF